MGYQVEKDWVTAAGLRAVVIMVRNSHRCGYVGVPPGHPLHGAGYGDPHPALTPPRPDEPVGKRNPISLLLAAADQARLQSPELAFDVHGSITFSGGHGEYPVPADLWWFGFDCAHAGDLSFGSPDGVLRSLDYCINECESLAGQIIAKTKGGTELVEA